MIQYYYCYFFSLFLQLSCTFSFANVMKIQNGFIYKRPEKILLTMTGKFKNINEEINGGNAHFEVLRVPMLIFT